MTSQHQIPTDIIFVVEGTALNGVYLHELKQHYIIPALEYFAGPIDEKDCGSDSNYCLFGLVVFHAADILPGFLTETHGPLTTSYQLLSHLDRIQFAGGHGEAAAHVGEGLATALECLQDLSKFRNNAADASEAKKHIILICNCKPYGLPIMESVGADGVYKGQTAEQVASGLPEKDVHLSVIAPRKIPALITLFDRAGGDLHVQKGYARDPRHLVLLNGFPLQVQERPSTPQLPKVQAAPEVPIPPAPVAVPAPASTSVQTTHAPVSVSVVSTTVPIPAPPTTVQSTPPPAAAAAAQVKPPQAPLPPQAPTAPPIIPIPASVPVTASGPAPTTLVQSLQQSIPSLPMPVQQQQQPVPPQQPVTQQPQAQAPMQQQQQAPPTQMPFRNPRPIQPTRAMLNQQQQQIANQLAQQQLNQQQQQQLNKQLHPSQQAQFQMQQGPGGQQQQQPVAGQQMGMHQISAAQQQLGQGQPPMNQQHLTPQQQQQLNQSQMNQQQQQASMQQQMINQQNQQQQQQLIQQQQQQQQQRWSSQLPQQAMQQQQELRMGIPGGPTGPQQPQAPNPQQLQQRAPEIVRVLNQPPIAQSQSPPTMGLPQLPLQQANIQKERRNIWSGLLEWHEKLKGPPEGQKVPRQVPCNVSANVTNNEPEVTGEGWPAKLIMQLIPKQIVGNLGGSYFMDVKTVAFMLQQCEALASLTRVMESGFAGCVHFTGSGACQIKVLILLYSKERCAYLGFIPNDQIGFVDRIRKVIQQQKTQQTALRQGQGQGGAFPPQQQPGMPPRMMGMGGQQLLSQQLQQQPGQQLQPGQQTLQGLQQQHLQAGQQMQPGPGQQQQLQAGQMPGVQQPPQLQQRQAQGLPPQSGDLDQRELERQRNVLEIQELQRQLNAARQRELELQQIQSGQMQSQIGNPQNPMQQGQQMGMGQQQQTPGQQQMGFSGLQQQQRQQLLQQQQQRGQRPTTMQQTNPGLKSLLQQQSANVGPQFRPGGPGQIAARMQGMHPQQGQQGQGQEQGGQMPAQPYDDVRILDLLR